MKRYFVIIGGFLLSFAGGATYSWGVFTVPLMELFDWNKYEANLSFTVFMLVFASGMLPAGMAADRFGYRSVARTGALMFLPAFFLAALIEVIKHPWWLPATHGLLGGIGCACVYSVIAPAVRSKIAKNTSLAVATALMGFGLASVFLAPLKASLLIPGLGVSGTLVVLGLSVFSLSYFATFLMPDKTDRSAGGLSSLFTIIKQTIQNKYFYFVWFVFALSVVGGFMSMGLFPSYARLQLKAGTGFAALVISVFAAVNGFGRPLAGFIAEKIGFAKVLLTTAFLQFVSLIILGTLPPSEGILLTVSAVTGWSFAAILGLFPSFTASVLGGENLGTRYGLVFTGFGLGSMALMGGSILYDLSGSFTPAFLGAAAISFASLVILSLLLFIQSGKNIKS